MDSLEVQRKYAKGLAVRTRITAAAVRAFATGGYGATSIMDLAATAQVTKNQLFHHFPGKEAIALAAVAAAELWWRNEVATAAQIYPDPGAQLEFMLKRTSEMHERGEAYLRLAAAFAMQHGSLPEALAVRAAALVGEITGFLRGRIKLLKRHGPGGQVFKARELALCLAAVLLGGEALAALGLETSGPAALELVLDLTRGGGMLVAEHGAEHTHEHPAPEE
jgi:AcrR family transcriptional regulator